MKKGEFELILLIVGIVGVAIILTLYGKYILIALAVIALITCVGAIVNYFQKKHTSNTVKNSNSKKSLFLTFTEQKHADYVKTHSKMFKKMVALNREYSFSTIYPQNYTEICNTLKAYNKIDEDEYLKNKIEENLYWYKQELAKAEGNLRLWNTYCSEYKKLELFLTKDEIKNLPERKVRVKTFEKIERKLYNLTHLSKPNCAFALSVDVSYTSPQGRNSYNKSAKLTHREIRELIPKIEEELLEKERVLTNMLEQKRKEKLEKEAEKLLKEEERQKLRKKREEERAKERKEILEYRERKRAEERLILAEYTAAQNKKLYIQLKAQEELLEKREAEFKAATKGHIYSLEHSNSPVLTSAEPNSAQSEDVSTWVKLKRLKSQFDNGEISHIEYEEQRKKLL